MGAMLPKPEQSQFRKIDVLREGVTLGREQDSMANNVVVTSKYNAVTFMPRSLFEQFRRIANIYFLVISILMIIGTYTTLFTSPLTPWSTLLPLFLVLLVTMVKDGVEDLKRHRSDKRVNNTKALALDIHNRGSFVDVHWKDVKVGMIMKVVDREEMPADLVLLTSSEAGGIGYIETANIDGETNLKIRTSAPTRPGQPPGPAWTSAEELHGVPMEMEYEAPNPRIHFFTGTLNVGGRGASSGVDNGESGRGISAPVEAPVDQSNLLLRGSRLRNTKWVLGVVAYTGKESKIAQNARSVPSKQSNLDKVTNKIMFVVFTCMVLVTTFSLVGYLIFSAQNDDQLYYLCDNYEDAPVALFRDNCEDSDSSSDAGQWFTFLILFNNFVPISLYVTLEMVNFIQASFIDQDLQMYDEAQDTPAQARSANMAGDLGQVEYVFSDKTGTLTQNLMKFKRCSVGGSIFGEVGQDAKDLMTPQQLSHVVDAPPLPVLAETVAKASAGAVSLEFALCLALNHTVMLETDPKTGEKRMQAESPDEEALVDGAKMLGVEFVNRSPGKVELEIAGRGRQAYKLMVTVPFDSTRKRMSVVVQAPDDSYVLYCKGADNIMMERAGKYIETDKAAVTSHLGVFSNDGLRTLLLGKRDMSKEFFDEWFSKYREASIATNGRAEKIAEVAKEVEGDLEILGVTAIEDKLQDDVPGTIADLGKAGVKLWVLTGDKMETAINIGYSCRLLVPEMTLIKLKEKEGDPKSVSNQLRALMLHFNKLVEDDGLVKRLWGTIKSNNPVGLVRRTVLRRTGGGGGDSGRVSPGVDDDRVVSLPEPLLEQPEGAPPLSELSAESLALVVDGPSLVHVLGNPEAERMLLALGSMCKSVVACRVSPAQKRLIVRLVKRGVVPTPVTLAIGDGANDVGMIQEAQIGVGISGKEGRQAVNNADFAIAQFRFLKRLMLVHGHWDYRRICKVILYSFYKNFVLVFVLFYFSFYAGFSGQSLFESMVYSGYNFFLAMPILLVGLFDKDVKAETALECHKLYAIGRLGMDLNIRVMTKWVCQAILDSLVIYFMPLTAYQNPVTVWAHRGYGDGLYVFGTTVYACLVMAMMLKVFNLTSTWNWQSWFFLLGSLALFFGFIAVYSLLVSWAYSYYYVAFQLMSRATFWILIIQVPCVTWAIDTLIRTVEHMFFPNVGNHASEFDRGFTSESGRQRRQDLKDRVREQEFESEGSGRVREIAGPRRDMAARKWKMGPEEMRALNETVDQRELDSMGISDGAEFRRQSSSFAFDHVTADFGPGASAAREELRSLVAEEGPERVRSTRVRSLTRWDSSALSTLDLESQRQRSQREIQGSGREASRSRMSSFSASQDSAAGSILGGTRQHQSSGREAPGSPHAASSSGTSGFGASQDSDAGSMFGGTQWGRGVAESKGEDI